jgi:hypothetical protein
MAGIPEHGVIGGLRGAGDGSSLSRMRPLATWKILILLTGWLAVVCFGAVDKEFDAIDGPNVRVMRHEDGARTLFTRTPDNRTLTKKKFSADGALVMITEYRMDAHSNPIGCKIYDGGKNQLFKVSYGYRKADGQLVEERMYDARVERKDPNTGKEMPVQRICYIYDAKGNRSAPIVYNLLPGKTFEEVFGIKSSALDHNPFGDSPSGDTANPNSRKLKK